jgi:hypothetical protein
MYLQGLVGDGSDAAERAELLGCPLVGGVETALESPLDLPRHASGFIRLLMRGGRGFLPGVNAGAPAANRR